MLIARTAGYLGGNESLIGFYLLMDELNAIMDGTPLIIPLDGIDMPDFVVCITYNGTPPTLEDVEGKAPKGRFFAPYDLRPQDAQVLLESKGYKTCMTIADPNDCVLLGGSETMEGCIADIKSVAAPRTILFDSTTGEKTCLSR